MAVIDQQLTGNYAIYNGDCCEVLPSMPDESVHLSVYSPPFCGLYNYSSSEHDMSNCRTYEEFFEHYSFLVDQIHRLTIKGRISAVHCMDTPAAVGGGLDDFPGDIVRLHKAKGFEYLGRHVVWKEPLGVRNRTMARGLAHKQIVDDSALCDLAHADFLLLFKKKGDNPIPIPHPVGLMHYAGEREIPADLLKYRGWTGKQTENRYSHWIWRQYASAFWDDIRINNVLPFKEARDENDVKHPHPLQLDVIERLIVLRSNPGETVLEPYLGVGSGVYQAVKCGRRGIGVELKPSYYRQAVQNIAAALLPEEEQRDLFASAMIEDELESMREDEPEGAA